MKSLLSWRRSAPGAAPLPPSMCAGCPAPCVPLAAAMLEPQPLGCLKPGVSAGTTLRAAPGRWASAGRDPRTSRSQSRVLRGMEALVHACRMVKSR